MTQIIWCATRGNFLSLTIVRPEDIHYTLESIQYLNFKLDIKPKFNIGHGSKIGIKMH